MEGATSLASQGVEFVPFGEAGVLVFGERVEVEQDCGGEHGSVLVVDGVIGKDDVEGDADDEVVHLVYGELGLVRGSLLIGVADGVADREAESEGEEDGEDDVCAGIGMLHRKVP